MDGKLDAAWVKIYNDKIAPTPPRVPDLAKLRQGYSALWDSVKRPLDKSLARTYDTSFTARDGAPIALRVYEPTGQTNSPWPVHVNFHGGGWGLGDLDTEAHICHAICAQAGVVVIDVDYRLVPEYAFPTGIYDSLDALNHIISHGQQLNVTPENVSVGGVSAGGAIALAMAHLARDVGITLKLVVAGTPVIDDITGYDTPADSPFESVRENECAPTLNWMRLKWFDKLKWSTGSEKAREDAGWFANLFNAPSSKDLPKTVIFTAGADPLRDEGEAYGHKLVEHGVEVTIKRYCGVPHPFMHMDKELWQARDFIDAVARHVKHALRNT